MKTNENYDEERIGIDNDFLAKIKRIDEYRKDCDKLTRYFGNKQGEINAALTLIFVILLYVLFKMRVDAQNEYIADCERLEERRAAL